MKLHLTLLAMISVLISCSTTRKPASGNNELVQDTLSYNMTKDSIVQDGLSFEKAVIINEKSETPGVLAEYKWLKEHYPNYKTKSQLLLIHDKKPFDVLTITSPDAKDVKIYFDTSNFYGKL